uniref:Nudix hydrolase domain-containing protein n=1 Tax=Parastrongyloides trichosuri TaxID=131310 RepID=A0A0N4ZNN3_PARTI
MLSRVPISSSTVLLNKFTKDLLLLRRGPTARFAPNLYVFPGGVIEKNIDTEFPMQLSNYGNIKGIQLVPERLENDFGLRVCSLRELFEETGLLFVADKVTNKKKTLSTLEDPLLNKMKMKIRKDPKLFKDLFTDFNIDLEILSPWSHWVTPATFPMRFETIFYKMSVDDNYKVDLCSKEMTDYTWMKALDVLKNPNVKNFLPPPQVYEMYKLYWSEFENIEVERDLIYPQLIFAKDPSKPDIYALPGDHLFIDNITEEVRETKRVMTVEEVDTYSKDKKVNRVIFSNFKDSNIADVVVRNFSDNDENKQAVKMQKLLSKYSLK